MTKADLLQLLEQTSSNTEIIVFYVDKHKRGHVETLLSATQNGPCFQLNTAGAHEEIERAKARRRK